MQYSDFDAGPEKEMLKIINQMPSFKPYKRFFPWLSWGPVFYRGRTNGSARVICVASDPAQIERIANRALVGDAGQRVQGFLGKIGVRSSYLCLNAFCYPFVPRYYFDVLSVSREQEIVEWRNALFNSATSEETELVLCYGGQASLAVELWPNHQKYKVVKIPHPSSRNPKKMLARWSSAVEEIQSWFQPEDGAEKSQNYGDEFTESDYAPVPKFDLPFGAPSFLGDNRWSRLSSTPKLETANRPPGDPDTIEWHAPLR